MAGQQRAPRKKSSPPGEVGTTRPQRGATGAGKGGGTSSIDRRELILAAAARRFAEYGFEATTVRQIADDVNLLSGSLYHHFATKEEILDEIVRDAVLTRRDRTIRIAALPIGAEERLVALIIDELKALTSQLEAFAIIFNERKFFRRSNDLYYVAVAKKEAYDAWQAILNDGVRDGLFRPDIDMYLTIATIVRMLNSGAGWYKQEDGLPLDAIASYPLERLMEFYVGFILRSIRLPHRVTAPIPQPELDF